MTDSVVNLTVHRNTLARREARRARDGLNRNARNLGKMEGIKGWSIVVWDADWNYKTAWDSNSTMPGNIMPEFIKRSLLREVSRSDAQDILDPVPPDDGA